MLLMQMVSSGIFGVKSTWLLELWLKLLPLWFWVATFIPIALKLCWMNMIILVYLNFAIIVTG